MDRQFRRVVVTGGAGFIGSHFVRRAVVEHPEWEIVVLDALTYAGNLDNLSGIEEQITFIHGDIADPAAVSSALSGADAVINFAAESHVDRSLMDARPFVRTNVEGTMVLLDGARKHRVGRFLQVSTDEVYGDLVGTEAHSVESDVFRPRSPYAATKTAAEHLVFAYGISYGLDVVVTRGSNTYGPNQYPEKIIPLFVSNALKGESLPLYGDGSAVRDYMHVEDHVSGIDTVLHRGSSGNAYNVGARLEISGLEVARAILACLGQPESMIRFVADRPGHDYRYSVDPSKAEQLGWVRRHTWEQGLADTVGWYVKNQAWWEQVRERMAHRDLVSQWYQRR